MRLGVHLVTYDFEGGPAAIAPMLAATGKAVDEAGIDNLSVMDHYWQMEMVGGPDLNMLEGYTTLGFLAAHTTSVELQLLVTGTTYRHPGLLAKIITTLDVLSGGRAVLGIGAAWYEQEAVGLGVPFPSMKERFERLEETLRIVRQMWSDDEGPFDGRHYQLGRTLNRPHRSARPRSWSAGAVRRRRFGSWRSTPMPATSSAIQRMLRGRSRSWRSYASTARTKAPPTTVCARRSRAWRPLILQRTGLPSSSR